MGNVAAALILQQITFDRCMTARGWDQTQIASLGAPKAIGKFDDWAAVTLSFEARTILPQIQGSASAVKLRICR
jgi:hypothetical protein